MLSVETEAGLILTNRAGKARLEAEKHQRQYPIYTQLQNAIAEQACREVMAIIKQNGEANELVDQAKKRVQELSREFEKLLKDYGLPPDYFEPHYECDKCKDTGYVDGHRCECMEHLMMQITCERMNASTPLTLSSFDAFDITYYSDERPDEHHASPRNVMNRTLAQCMRYANNFEKDFPSLIFQGGTGLGKTHLALAIAGEVMRKGYSVIYDTSPNIFAALENARFGRTPAHTLDEFRQCNLLIIDDLGAEFRAKNLVPLLYDIIDSRVMARKPMIITTNLTMQGITELYGERIASRIFGSCRRLGFEGKDVRIEKRRRNLNAKTDAC